MASIGLLKPVAELKEFTEWQNQLDAFIESELKEGRDFGALPGNDKPKAEPARQGNRGQQAQQPAKAKQERKCLWKAGAERICAYFGVKPDFEIADSTVDPHCECKIIRTQRVYNNAYQGDSTYKTLEEPGTVMGLYRYVIKCRLVNSDGVTVGTGSGACSTLESKYVSRPNDSENTVLKMAEKRSYVAATLILFCLSDRFTQDLEDLAPASEPKAPEAAQAPAPAPAAPQDPPKANEDTKPVLTPDQLKAAELLKGALPDLAAPKESPERTAAEGEAQKFKDAAALFDMKIAEFVLFVAQGKEKITAADLSVAAGRFYVMHKIKDIMKRTDRTVETRLFARFPGKNIAQREFNALWSAVVEGHETSESYMEYLAQ